MSEFLFGWFFPFILPLALAALFFWRGAVSRQRSQYAARCLAQWQLMVVLMDPDPDDAKMGRINGRFDVAEVDTLIKVLAEKAWPHEYLAALKTEFPRHEAN